MKTHTNNPISSASSPADIESKGSNEVDRKDHVIHYIYESVAIHFNVQIFFEQFFAHMFYPLHLWLSPNHGAQRFTSSHPVVIMFNHVAPFFCEMMIASYILLERFASPLEKTNFNGAIWYPLFFFASHRLTIGSKYASLSPGEYKKFMATRDVNMLNLFDGQMFLLQAWNKEENILVTDFEITACALRLGCQLDRHYFLLPAPRGNNDDEALFSIWNSFLSNCSTLLEYEEDENGTIRIPLFQFCQAVRHHVHSHCFALETPLRTLSYCLSFGLTAIPLISLRKFNGQNGSVELNDLSVYTIIFLITSTYLLFLFSWVQFQFIFVSLYDVRRQHRCAFILNSMLRLSDMDGSLQMEFSSRSSSSKATDHSSRRLGEMEKIAKTQETVAVEMPAFTDAACVFLNGFTGAKGDATMGNRSTTTRKTTEYSASDRKELSELKRQRRRQLRAYLHSRQDALADIKSKSSVVFESRVSVVGPNSSHNHHRGETFDDENLFPRISARYQENFIVWAWARSILMNIGIRYRARLDFFVTLCLLFNVVVMIGTLFFVFQQPVGNRIEAFTIPLFFQTVVTSTFYSAFLVVYTALGASVNHQLKLHRVALSMQLVRVQERIQDLTKLQIFSDQELTNANSVDTNDKDNTDNGEDLFQEINLQVQKQLKIDLLRLRGSQEAIKTCSDLVGSSNEYTPFRILNINAQYSLTFSIISFFVSFVISLTTAFSSEGNL